MNYRVIAARARLGAKIGLSSIARAVINGPDLLTSFGAAWECFVAETFERSNRKQAVGAGRIAHLRQLEDKLLFILLYYSIRRRRARPFLRHESVAGE